MMNSLCISGGRGSGKSIALMSCVHAYCMQTHSTDEEILVWAMHDAHAAMLKTIFSDTTDAKHSTYNGAVRFRGVDIHFNVLGNSFNKTSSPRVKAVAIDIPDMAATLSMLANYEKSEKIKFAWFTEQV